MENEFTEKIIACIKEYNTKIAEISEANTDRIELNYKTITQNGSTQTFNFLIDIKPRNGDLEIKLPYVDNKVNYDVFVDRIKQMLNNSTQICGDITDLFKRLQTIGTLKENSIIFDKKESVVYFISAINLKEEIKVLPPDCVKNILISNFEKIIKCVMIFKKEYDKRFYVNL